MFNAAAFCKDYNIDYEQTKNGWVNINCPFCHDQSFHGGINIYGSYFNCWKCGGRNLHFLIKTLLLIHTNEAFSILNDYDFQSQIIQDLNDKKKIQTVSKIDMIGEELKKKHIKYLENRGFDVDYLINKYKITGTLNYPFEFKYRVIVPIFYKGRLVSYQGRDITGKSDLRWNGLSPSESVIPYKYIFYAMQYSNYEQVGIVEGIMDQWKMGDGFICSFGTALTTKQLKLLLKYKRIFFLFDPGALDKAQKYAKILSSIKKDIEVEYIDLELGKKDPGDLNRDEVKHIRKELGFI